MELFGLGPAELAIIAVIVLVLFGPKRLPQLGKSIGEAMKSVKEGLAGFNEERQDAPEQSAAAVEPAAAEPAAVEPAAVDPAAVEPAAVEPAAVEPVVAEKEPASGKEPAPEG